MTTKELLDEYAENKSIIEWFNKRPITEMYIGEAEQKLLSTSEERMQEIEKELEASIRKEVYAEMLEFLKEPEEYCLQHYGYATDKQEDEIYTQGMQDFKAYKIIKLLNRINK